VSRWLAVRQALGLSADIVPQLTSLPFGPQVGALVRRDRELLESVEKLGKRDLVGVHACPPAVGALTLRDASAGIARGATHRSQLLTGSGTVEWAPQGDLRPGWVDLRARDRLCHCDPVAERGGGHSEVVGRGTPGAHPASGDDPRPLEAAFLVGVSEPVERQLVELARASSTNCRTSASTACGSISAAAR
jgi:hypothetical protein